MLAEAFAVLPRWLVAGAALGVAASALVAVLFVVLVRRYPGDGGTDGPTTDGESRRRSEIRAYLDAIGESYVEDHIVAGQSVEFFLPARAVALTFDARTYYRLEGAEVTAVLVEHELPGVALGARLPFETPSVAAEDNPSAIDPTAAAFAVLDLPAGASTEEVRRAYRRKVKEVHPDLGGDEAAFRRVREAYATAMNAAG
ncbi:MAG: J domain-containing protein [Haloarculaceae archaeon]